MCMLSAMDLRIEKLSHVMIGVSDLARSLAFYRDILGLKVLMQFEGFAFFASGETTLVLNDGVWRHMGERTGAVQLVLGVADVTGAHAELVRRGVTFTQPPRNVNGQDWAANFNDPDGHALSIFGPEKARA